MKIGILALALSAIALAVATTSMPSTSTETSRAAAPDNRVNDLEAKVERLAAEVRSLKTRRRAEAPAATPEGVRPTTAGDDGVPRSASEQDALTAAVDKAVDRKTKEVIDDLKIKANKKPEINDFAKVLKLTPEQREEADRVIVEGQRETYALLETPTQDGSNLMTELVDLVARGFAEPGKDHGWGKWLGRIMTEKIPGTDQTYAERLEQVKQGMNAEFKRTWTPAQYKEFEAWGVNPTEIKGVPGSPEVELAKRIVHRARMFGAEIPEDAADK